MKRMRTSGYTNYGSIPQNEYADANTKKSTDSAAPLVYKLQTDDMAYMRRLLKRQAQHPSGRRKIRGWARSWKANGWRAESTSLQDEYTGMGMYSSYVRKNNRLL